MSGRRAPGALSSVPVGFLQRDDKEETKKPPKPNNYDEAAKKIGDAVQETPFGKQLKAEAEKLGKDFLSSVEGKVIAGSALGGALAAIIATNSKLPVPIPELPLDFIRPGLKARLIYEGPVQQPTNVGLTLTSGSGVSVSAAYTKTAATPGKPAEEKAGLTLTIPLGGSPAKKKTPSESDKIAAETAQLRTEQEQMRESMKTPGERKNEQEFLDSYLRYKANDPLNPLNYGRKKEDLLLMRSATNDSGPQTAPSIVNEALAGSGQPLDSNTRAFMEERFGFDFSRVRIHTDEKAVASARAVNAAAYTVGEQVAFDAARYAPGSSEGSKLLAHELAHVVQQRAAEPGTVGQVFRSAASRGVGQGSGPTSVSLSTGTQVVHTPPCGGQTITATVAPSALSGITWSLHDDGTKVDPGSSINQAGEITLGNAQTGGPILVRATAADGASADIQLILHSHPTDISSTSAIGPPPDAKTNYGGTFDHVFKSNDGKVESLEGVAVGEHFPNVPTPDAATHAITGTPFGNGNLTLTTATLTPGATNNWFLTRAGGLNGNHDRVSIERAGINVGEHIASTSNPKPAHPLPAGFSLQQDLHWYCPAAAADKRWTNFKSIDHVRQLRLDSGGEPEFVVSVNKTERTDAYSGTTGVQKISATPATITKSPAKGKANTVQISATALPSTRKLHFSLQGNANGCSINAQTGLLTIGKQAGAITVRAANASGGSNYDELGVTITDPAAAKTPPAGGTPTSPPGSKTSTEALPDERAETSGENRGFGEPLFGLGQGAKEGEAPKEGVTTKKPASKAKKSAPPPSYKYKTGDLRAVPDWSYIAYPEQGKVLLRFFSSAAKIQIGTIGWITNNPGNIDYAARDDPNAGPAAKEARKQGAYEKNPADTRYRRFAIFPTRATGVEAVLPVLGKYVESNPDLTVEDAVKRYKGSEKDFSDFKLLFPNEPTPQTEAEKKTAASRVTQAYADAVRGHIHDQLHDEDKDLGEAEIQKRVEHVMTHKFSELDQSSADARLLRSGLIEKEGGLITPGVEFSCGNGFTSMNLLAYSEPQRKKILQLVSSAEAYTEMQAVLGCDEKKEKP